MPGFADGLDGVGGRQGVAEEVQISSLGSWVLGKVQCRILRLGHLRNKHLCRTRKISLICECCTRSLSDIQREMQNEQLICEARAQRKGHVKRYKLGSHQHIDGIPDTTFHWVKRIILEDRVVAQW